MTSTYEKYTLTFQCAVCAKLYKTPWDGERPVDILFQCSCGTPLAVKTIKAEPDEHTPVV